MTATATHPSGTPDAAAPPPSRWRRLRRHPLTHLVAALLVIALVQSFAVKVYQVPTASMAPELAPGDRVLADRISTALRAPEPGDVVVFERPDEWQTDAAEPRPAWRIVAGWFGDVFGFGPSNSDALAKRIVAGPGSTVACCDLDGRIVVDGNPLDEPYIQTDLPFEAGLNDCETAPRSSRCFPAIELGDDEYLALGDNRAVSNDSVSACRVDVPAADCARTVSRGDIIGTVFFRIWPLTG